MYYCAHFLLVNLVKKFAQEQIQPFVSEMDEKHKMDEGVLRGLFEQGVSVLYIDT